MQTEEGTTQTVTYDLVVAYQWMKEQQDSYNYTFIHNLLSSSESFLFLIFKLTNNTNVLNEIYLWWKWSVFIRIFFL